MGERGAAYVAVRGGSGGGEEIMFFCVYGRKQNESDVAAVFFFWSLLSRGAPHARAAPTSDSREMLHQMRRQTFGAARLRRVASLKPPRASLAPHARLAKAASC